MSERKKLLDQMESLRIEEKIERQKGFHLRAKYLKTKDKYEPIIEENESKIIELTNIIDLFVNESLISHRNNDEKLSKKLGKKAWDLQIQREKRNTENRMMIMELRCLRNITDGYFNQIKH